MNKNRNKPELRFRDRRFGVAVMHANKLRANNCYLEKGLDVNLLHQSHHFE